MNRVKTLLAATIAIALAFTISCSSDDGEKGGDEGDNTGGGGGNSTFTDNRDGKVYGTVKIGTQIWMANNLGYNAAGGSRCGGFEDNGNLITTDDYFLTASNTAICDTYGRLYNWSTAQSACPSGWHLPSYDEWNMLLTTVGGLSTAGTKLRAKSGWEDLINGNSGNGTDDYGFSALPGGYGSSGGGYYYVGTWGYWWSATNQGNYAYSLRTRNGSDDVGWQSNSNRLDYYSVRCVKDLQE